jgi:zinc protease
MKKNKTKNTQSNPAHLTNYGSSAVSSLPGTDDIFRETLPNGITVLVRSNFASPSVVMSGYLNAGSLFESDEKLGLADFTATMLMRGTQKRDFHQIYDAIESVGANLGFSGGAHTTGFSGRALTEDLPLLMGLMAECLIAPAFPDEQVERLRAQLLTSLAMRAQDTSDMASMAFDEIVFANHPYARPDDGYPETVKAISREDMISFHDSYFGPRGLTLAIVGAVEPSFVMDQVAGSLGQWENPAQPELPALPPVTPLDGVIRKHVSIPGKIQTDMYLGVSGPTRNSPDYLAVLLGNSVLGQFGMMGRIGDVVREKSGLAYYAYSSVSAGVGPGAWEVSAGVNNANVERAVELVREEIRRFVGDGVTDDELADSKANFIGRLPLSMESNMGVANSLLSIERYHLGMDYYRHYAEMVQSVTAEQVVEAARRYLNPEKLAIATAGG